MTASTPDRSADPFSAALASAAGRDASLVLPGALLAFARRIVDHGRTIERDGACPTRLVRRAEALFSPRRRGVRTALWSILFDSAAGAMPATRGLSRSRVLRLGGPGGAIQAELSGLGTTKPCLVGALEGVAAGAVVVLEPSRGAAVRASVSDGGTFEFALPRATTSFALSVRVGRRVVARTPIVEIART